MKRRISFPIEIILIALVLFLLVSNYRSNKRLKDLETLSEERKIVYEDLERQIADLEEKMESVGTLKYIEKIAREEYGMVKPKEIIFVDMDKKNKEKD